MLQRRHAQMPLEDAAQVALAHAQPLCQRAFQDALALSPAFRLTKAEQGHPVWGPVFTKALQQSQPARRR